MSRGSNRRERRSCTARQVVQRCETHQRGSADLEFGGDAFAVQSDGGGRDAQPTGDLFIDQTVAQFPEDLAFAWAERSFGIVVRQPRARGEEVHHLTLQGRVGLGLFHHPVDMKPQPRRHDKGRSLGGENDGSGIGMQPSRAPGHIRPASVRQSQIENKEVGARLLHRAQSLLAAMGHGNLTFTGGSPYNDGGYTLTLNNFFHNNSLTLGGVDLSSQIPASFSGTSFTSADGLFTINSVSGAFISSYDSDANTFTIVAIPEPSTYAAAAGLIALLLWPHRRRLLAVVRPPGRRV